ncbi:hypothetical protein BZL30_3828 [Mycobacterium kansasii]|uniref:Uncharacterized protein n=1 Tax=Mycobacterium kansasii TaxID=1768 RepID=A0A1V3XCX5_MYCKA|nr:hypothetical protein BZL30_3828 [Mycobacterium kansasii]
MLVTAVAATVVIVSWVLNRPPHSTHERPPAQDTQLVEKPLIGLGGGVTVRELTQDTPFSLVALTGDLAGTSTRVRAKRPDGSWGRGTRPSMKPRHPMHRARIRLTPVRGHAAPIRCSSAAPRRSRSRSPARSMRR